MLLTIKGYHFNLFALLTEVLFKFVCTFFNATIKSCYIYTDIQLIHQCVIPENIVPPPEVVIENSKGEGVLSGRTQN